jgi:hypothetical protein
MVQLEDCDEIFPKDVEVKPITQEEKKNDGVSTKIKEDRGEEKIKKREKK